MSIKIEYIATFWQQTVEGNEVNTPNQIVKQIEYTDYISLSETQFLKDVFDELDKLELLPVLLKLSIQQKLKPGQKPLAWIFINNGKRFFNQHLLT